jgi:hypothetical protein
MAIFSQPSGGAYPLKSGDTATWHRQAYGNPADGRVQSTVAAGLVNIGVFDNRGGDVVGDGTALVQVDYTRERPGRWYANDGTNPVAFVFTPAYGIAGGDTVSSLATGRTLVGTVLALDSVKGVFVAFI